MYNKVAIMQHLGHNVDSMSDPQHPLANSDMTAFLHDIADNTPEIGQLAGKVNHPVTGKPMSATDILMHGLEQHVDAANDPTHPQAPHAFTQVIRNMADHLNTQGPHFGIMAPAPAATPSPLAMNNPITSPMLSTTSLNMNNPIISSPMGVMTPSPGASPAPVSGSLQGLQRAMLSNRGPM